MKINRILFIAILSFASISMYGQENTEISSNWKRGGLVSVNFSQVALHNWAAGGENTISGVSFVNLFANYKKNKMTWDNTVDLGYGLMKQGDNGLIKSDDKIEIASKYGQYAFEKWYYTGLLNFKTQFAPGFQKPTDLNKISDFMAPAYLNIAIGMDFKPNDNFTLFLSPVTGKITIVNSPYLSGLGAYGITPGESIRYEFGGYIKVAYKVDIMENVNFQTKLDLFSNYFHNPGNIDINWESMLAFKVNDFLSANIFFMMIYDDDIKIAIDTDDDGIADKSGPRAQMKEMFGLGLSYKF